MVDANKRRKIIFKAAHTALAAVHERINFRLAEMATWETLVVTSR